MDAVASANHRRVHASYDAVVAHQDGRVMLVGVQLSAVFELDGDEVVGEYLNDVQPVVVNEHAAKVGVGRVVAAADVRGSDISTPSSAPAGQHVTLTAVQADLDGTSTCAAVVKGQVEAIFSDCESRVAQEHAATDGGGAGAETVAEALPVLSRDVAGPATARSPLRLPHQTAKAAYRVHSGDAEVAILALAVTPIGDLQHAVGSHSQGASAGQ